MKKILLFLLLIMVVSCSQKEEFIKEAKSSLKEAVEQSINGNVSIEDLDTIFTAKKHGTDSVFMIGFKFRNNSVRYEYIYQNLDGEKMDLLIDLRQEKSASIEEFANKLYREKGYSYNDLVFSYAAMKLSLYGKNR